MSLLIKGMEMPTDDYIDIRVFPGGKCENARIATATTATAEHPFYRTFDVVELPPHGRLIDADALYDVLMELEKNEYTPQVFARFICNHEEIFPTIIKSEGER